MRAFFEHLDFSEICFFGYVENVPRHILTFEFRNLKNQHFLKNVKHVDIYSKYIGLTQHIPSDTISMSDLLKIFVKLSCHSTTCRVFFVKMTPSDFLITYIVNLSDFHGFEASLDFFPKSGQSDQMTVPARRGSKFSAQWRAIKRKIIFPKSEFLSNSWILRTLV